MDVQFIPVILFILSYKGREPTAESRYLRSNLNACLPRILASATPHD